ncbi:MAG: FtsQ-type POTRA domain-containing protein [Chitinivibrionales bacterium]|nr:FtsQ-type POTRA domain-containing protein [Chitinivibrionales bacterium]
MAEKRSRRIGANRKKRLAESRRSRKKINIGMPKWVIVAVAGGAVAAAGAFGWMQWKPRVVKRIKAIEMFRVDSIEVSRMKIIGKEKVLALSGIEEGVHMLDIKPRKVKTVLEKLEWVKCARVMRRLPDKIKIDVIEREPCALIAAGKVYYMDKDGVLLPLLPGTMSELPLIHGLADSIRTDDNGRRVTGETVKLVNGFFAKIERRGSPLAGSVGQVDFSDPEKIRFTIAPGGTVVSIETEETTKKIEQLCRLLSILERDGGRVPAHINLCRNNFAYVH